MDEICSCHNTVYDYQLSQRSSHIHISQERKSYQGLLFVLHPLSLNASKHQSHGFVNVRYSAGARASARGRAGERWLCMCGHSRSQAHSRRLMREHTDNPTQAHSQTLMRNHTDTRTQASTPHLHLVYARPKIYGC